MNDRINVDGEVFSSNDIRALRQQVRELTEERNAAQREVETLKSGVRGRDYTAECSICGRLCGGTNGLPCGCDSIGGLTRVRSDADGDIDDGVCTSCNRTVTYNEASDDDEMCRRTKPYCTAPDDERVDWRASCLHATKCALDAERDRDSLRQQVRELTEERDAYRTDAATLAEIVGVDPAAPGERRLLDEVAMHVCSTFESHRRLAHDLSAALVSVDAMAERIEQMRPVYEAAVEWRERSYPNARSWIVQPRDAALVSAIDTALAHTARDLRSIVQDGARRFDEKPRYRASIDARAELRERIAQEKKKGNGLELRALATKKDGGK